MIRSPVLSDRLINPGIIRGSIDEHAHAHCKCASIVVYRSTKQIRASRTIHAFVFSSAGACSLLTELHIEFYACLMNFRAGLGAVAVVINTARACIAGWCHVWNVLYARTRMVGTEEHVRSYRSYAERTHEMHTRRRWREGIILFIKIVVSVCGPGGGNLYLLRRW